MKKKIYYLLFFIILSNNMFAQSIDDTFSQKKMQKDLEVFKDIRVKANSGLYTYRTKSQIDSIYSWASDEVQHLKSYRDFYNLLTLLTDYEGSLHNNVSWSDRLWKSINNESGGYFPFPLKIIEGKLLVNIEGKSIPLGAEVISINRHNKDRILQALGKYYTTDGYNTTGKDYGVSKGFSRYYRYHFGLKTEFEVIYKQPKFEGIQKKILNSISYKELSINVGKRHSYDFDRYSYEEIEEEDYYSFKKIDSQTAVLTINTFSLGGAKSKTHLKYKTFLDSVFVDLNENKFKNLIVDIRNNGGGNPPNDMITLSYLTTSTQKEIQTAWIGFTNTIPYWKYFQIEVPFYLKPFAKKKLKKMIEQQLPIVENNRRYYKNIISYDSNENRFQGQIYLLIAPPVASAASLFAAMVSSNTNAIVIGEETMGGYYGHNGSFSLEYKLPKSNLLFDFSMVNLAQDVQEKDTQPLGRGVMPDYYVTQNFEDFMNNEDTQMRFVLDFINENKKF